MFLTFMIWWNFLIYEVVLKTIVYHGFIEYRKKNLWNKISKTKTYLLCEKINKREMKGFRIGEMRYIFNRKMKGKMKWRVKEFCMVTFERHILCRESNE